MYNFITREYFSPFYLLSNLSAPMNNVMGGCTTAIQDLSNR